MWSEGSTLAGFVDKSSAITTMTNGSAVAIQRLTVVLLTAFDDRSIIALRKSHIGRTWIMKRRQQGPYPGS
jgi:hypothetical protein